MRLTDLEPRWVSESGRHGQGMTFACPAGCGGRLGVPFANPVDGGGPLPPGMRGSSGDFLWQRSGDTFESMTLTPSVDASRVERMPEESDESYAKHCRPCTQGGWAHWHGFITNGEAR